MEVTVTCPAERLDTRDDSSPQANARGSDRARRFLGLVTRPLPGHQHAPRPQQRRGVLRENRERGDGPHGDGVVRLGAVAGGPPLRPLGHHPDVVESRRGRKPLDDGALSRGRLDEVHSCAGERRCQRQPREAHPGADVRDPAGLPQLGDPETGEAVGEVPVDGLLGSPDRGRRVRLARQCVEERG